MSTMLKSPVRLLLMAVLLAGAAVLVPIPSSAAVITIQPVQFDIGVQNLHPETAAIDVSCSSSGNCVAVGYVLNIDGDHVPYAQIETNGSWGLAFELAVPGQVEPSGDAGPFVSCTGQLDCAVVASTSRGVYTLRFAEGQWGTANKLTSAPGMTAWLSPAGLECAAPGECIIAATTSDNRTTDHGVVYEQTAGQWGAAQVLELPAPGNLTPLVILRGVTCSAVGTCVVVGTYVHTLTSSGTLGGGFIAEEIGGQWATPFDTGTFAPEGISCSSASDCAAVGTMDGTFHPEAAVMTKAAGVWTAPVMVVFDEGTQARRPSSALNEVSCPADGSCTAVGNFMDRIGARIAMSVTLDSSGWGTAMPIRFDPAETAAQPNQGLGLINCSAPGACTAVGLLLDPEGRQVGFSTSMTNGTWEPPQILGRAATAGGALEFSIPRSMACSGATSCVMVGDQRSTNGSMGFVYDIGFAPRQMSVRAASSTFSKAAPIRIVVSAKGFPKPTIAAVSTIPAGLQIRHGVITGSLPQRGTYSFKIKAKNRWGSVTRTVTITVS